MAESFGSDAERYDRTRPRYPQPLIDRIVATAPGPDVLDVGCGTGISSRPFQAAGCRVLGVEPDARMAAFARRTGITAEVATFEAWDPAGRAFDAVVSGQTWHWVDPVAGTAKAAQVLRPGGLLAVFWNAFELPPEVAEVFAEAHRQVLPGPPPPRTQSGLDGYGVLCAKAADGIRRTDGLSDPEQWRYVWEHRYTRDAWLDQMPTLGLFTRLPPESLARALEVTGAAIDSLGGGFTLRYTTLAVTASRTGTP